MAKKRKTFAVDVDDYGTTFSDLKSFVDEVEKYIADNPGCVPDKCLDFSVKWGYYDGIDGITLSYGITHG